MVEVTYRGGNMDGITSNAASEAPLLKLLAKMDKGAGGGAQRCAEDIPRGDRDAGMLRQPAPGLAQRADRHRRSSAQADTVGTRRAPIGG